MAKLLTHHDPLHAHALLGALALAHYVIRWTLILCTGSAFLDKEPTWFRIAGVSIHVLLPLVSLILPVPRKRNLSKPMIWPEFRLHSLLFASRHVIACAIATFYPNMSETIFLCIGVILHQGTMAAASYVTTCIGDVNLRTTNAMPYPKSSLETEVTHTRAMYREAQFLASAMMHCRNPTLCFMPLLAIQIAPFLMTLVRKNLAKPALHHAVYAWALWLNVPGLVSVLWNSTNNENNKDGYREVMFSLLAYKFTSYLRVQHRLDWIVGPVGALAVIQGCQTVSPFLTDLLPTEISCPRRWWLLAKFMGAAVATCRENGHVMLPVLNRGFKSASILQSSVDMLQWFLGAGCDFVFTFGVLLSFGVVLVNPTGVAQQVL
jgi:hypothetical protein